MNQPLGVGHTMNSGRWWRRFCNGLAFIICAHGAASSHLLMMALLTPELLLLRLLTFKTLSKIVWMSSSDDCSDGEVGCCELADDDSLHFSKQQSSSLLLNCRSGAAALFGSSGCLTDGWYMLDRSLLFK